MKVLWTTNITLPTVAELVGLQKENKEGWLQSLARELIKCSDFHLAIMSFEKSVKELKILDKDGVKYFVVPLSALHDIEGIDNVVRVVKTTFSPDILHINGTEYNNALKILHRFDIPSVISIQGLTHVCSRYIFTGFDMSYLLSHPLFTLWLYRNQLAFYRKGINEINYLSSVQHVIGRTDWDRVHTTIISPHITYHTCNENLRPPFYENCWQLRNVNRHQIYISQANYQIKGFHIIINAIKILKEEYPDLKVIVAGKKTIVSENNNIVHKFLSLFDYGHYVKKKMNIAKILDCVEFVGNLNADQVVNAMLSSHVSIVPSTVENSPNSLGEAMILGLPCVASYVGGIPSMSDYGHSCLLYRCEEWEMLVDHVRSIFNNDNLAIELSKRARNSASIKHNRQNNTKHMINIYQTILNSKDK